MLDIELLADNSLKTVNSLDEVTEFRVTGLVAFETCPRRWSAEIQGAVLTDPKALERSQKYSRIGTAAHHVIETYLTTSVDPDDAHWWKEAEEFCKKAGMPPAERENLRTFLGMLAPWRERMRHTEHKVRRGNLDALPFAGTLDYVGWCEEDQCWDICDWKTNREFEPAEVWAQKLQPLLYTVLLRQWLLRKETDAGWHFVNPPAVRYTIGYVNLGQFVTWMTDPKEDDPNALVRYLNLFKEFEVYRRTGEFPARVNKFCSNCPLRDRCPAAREAVESLSQLAGEMDAENVSPLARHEFLTNAVKLAEGMLEEVREEIRCRMTLAEVDAWEDGGWTATLRGRKTRSANALSVLDELHAYFGEVNARAYAAEVLSVKMTALDKVVARHPDMAPALVGLITSEESETQTLSIRKLKSRTLQGVDI